MGTMNRGWIARLMRAIGFWRRDRGNGTTVAVVDTWVGPVPNGAAPELSRDGTLGPGETASVHFRLEDIFPDPVMREQARLGLLEFTVEQTKTTRDSNGQYWSNVYLTVNGKLHATFRFSYFDSAHGGNDGG